MAVPVRNLQQIKSKDKMLGEALEDIRGYLTNIGQSLAVDPSGRPATPPTINKLHVVAQDGIYHATITDNNPIYRTINYHLEYSPNSDFSNSHLIPLGPSRSARINLGNQTLHFRAYSQYVSGGPASTPVVHGNGITAAPVVGGGTSSGPIIPVSTGAGTNLNPSGGQGAGKESYTQTSAGLPPRLS